MPRRLRVTVLGFALTPERFADIAERDAGMPVQTQRFGVAILKALRLGGAEPVMISAAPVTDYPHNPQVLFRRNRQVHDGIEYHEIGFINVTGLKHTSRLISMLATAVPLTRNRATDALLVHGVHSPFLAAALLVRWRTGVSATAILTDPPNVPHAFDNWASKSLKKIDSRLVTLLLRRFDGVIGLTAPLARDYAPGVPAIIMEGIAPDIPDSVDMLEIDKPFGSPEVVYAGGLSEAYGVRLLIEAYRQSKGEYRLTIYGKGPMSDEVYEAAQHQDGLQYGGMVRPEEMGPLLRAADLLVNPRPLGQGFVNYSFPSKLLEYMASATPVVTTRLPGIPAEYWDFAVGADDTASGLARAIRDTLDSPQASAMGQAARTFVMTRKSAKFQGKRIVEFLAARSARRGESQSSPRRRP